MRRLSLSVIGCALAIGVIPVLLAAQGAAQRPAPPPRPPAVSPEYTFPSGSGALFFYVRPEKAADFEAIVTRLGQVLDASADPVRRQQSAGWRIYKSTETTREATVYVFFFDQAVSGSDYDPIKVLGESAPTEGQALLDRMKADVVKIERMGLGRLR